jgi:hypothetical protein
MKVNLVSMADHAIPKAWSVIQTIFVKLAVKHTTLAALEITALMMVISATMREFVNLAVELAINAAPEISVMSYQCAVLKTHAKFAD